MTDAPERTTTSAAALVPAERVLSRRAPEELTVDEHVEILQRLRRVSLVQSAVAGGVGGVIGVLAPPIAVVPAMVTLFLVGRAMRGRQLMPYQRILAEYGIDAEGEERLRKAWRLLRRQRRKSATERATIVFEALRGPDTPSPTGVVPGE